ncbi:barstar family protein [Microbacterium sp.]|uniref:barstar family protein n=1 Tax=Microbacterium sp. TaxID=51671 RepID=UPI003566361B
MTTWNDISGTASPWVHRLDESLVAQLLNRASGWPGTVVTLEGSLMRTAPTLFGVFASAFKFPDYFGDNWAAFHESMTELEAMPAKGYLTVIRRSELLLADDPADLPTFIRQLGSIGQHWSRSFGLGPQWGGGEVPFRTLFSVAEPIH